MTLDARLRRLEETLGCPSDVEARATFNLILIAAVVLEKLSEETASELQQSIPAGYRPDADTVKNAIRRLVVGDDRRFRDLWPTYAPNVPFPFDGPRGGA